MRSFADMLINLREAQLGRIKMIERQMYGRAGFDLLRKRVLLADRFPAEHV